MAGSTLFVGIARCPTGSLCRPRFRGSTGTAVSAARAYLRNLRVLIANKSPAVVGLKLPAALVRMQKAGAKSAYPRQFPRLDPWCDEIAEPRADVQLRSKCCASRLHVDDDADRSPANLGRPVRLIKSNFGPDEEVQMANDPLSGVVSSMRGQRHLRKSPAVVGRGHAHRGAEGQGANALQTTDGPPGAPGRAVIMLLCAICSFRQKGKAPHEAGPVTSLWRAGHREKLVSHRDAIAGSSLVYGSCRWLAISAAAERLYRATPRSTAGGSA